MCSATLLSLLYHRRRELKLLELRTSMVTTAAQTPRGGHVQYAIGWVGWCDWERAIYKRSIVHHPPRSRPFRPEPREVALDHTASAKPSPPSSCLWKSRHLQQEFE